MCILGQEDFETGLFSQEPGDASVIRPTRPEDISIILAVDNVAQEGIERGTLRLVLAPGSSPPPGTFFKRDLAVTVEDTSSEYKSPSNGLIFS